MLRGISTDDDTLWTSDDSRLALNPRTPGGERRRLERLVVPDLRRHIWIATSGTTGAVKLTALSKEAILASAGAVNRRLEATRDDVWLRVLPAFHVGGLGIHARAFLSGSRVISSEWDPARFAVEEFTLSALVPAQVRDLVQQRLRPPASARAIVVGGGALPEDLYSAGRDLGWPLLPSYGLTETASQIATARRDSPRLRLLDHVRVRIDGGFIAVSGPSLLTGYATDSGFVDPKVGGWLVTEDRGELEGDVLRVFGRSSEFVKIGGESVDLKRLDAILDDLRGTLDAAVVAVPDQRLGHVIHLAVAGEASKLVEAFNERVMPFERIRGVHRVTVIPRSELGKLTRSRLLAAILT
jgi:O-succinylbenzoic acid--CoA ligase